MTVNLEALVQTFLAQHMKSNDPLLLALSGGPDSMSLLHLLMQMKVNFGIAHVDHGWRAESATEADALQSFAKENALPFHLRKLDPSKLKGNLEAACRRERLDFFEKLCREHGYQAVMLGHHADDQAETVLKKVLEGVSLPHLSALQSSVKVNGLTLWRPLLSVTKVTITRWLEERDIAAFEDKTNRDPRFLRGKFRTSIIPQLTEEFGKEITSSLCRLAEEAASLRSFLDERVEPFLAKAETGCMGVLLDLSSERPDSLFELNYLIRKLCEMEGFVLSRQMFDAAASFVWDKASDKRLVMGKHEMILDRGRIFILKQGNWDSRSWKITVEKSHEQKWRCSGWKEVWKGTAEVILPEGDYQLQPPTMNILFPGQSPISKWWTNGKVPAFLRQRVPLLCQGDEVVCEFLTGKPRPVVEKPQQWVKITLSISR